MAITIGIEKPLLLIEPNDLQIYHNLITNEPTINSIYYCTNVLDYYNWDLYNYEEEYEENYENDEDCNYDENYNYESNNDNTNLNYEFIDDEYFEEVRIDVENELPLYLQSIYTRIELFEPVNNEFKLTGIANYSDYLIDFALINVGNYIVKIPYNNNCFPNICCKINYGIEFHFLIYLNLQINILQANSNQPNKVLLFTTI